MSDQAGNDVVVVARRKNKPQPHATLIISSSSEPFKSVPLYNFIAGLVRDQTTFFIDPAFTPEQRKLVNEVLKRIADHPELAAAFRHIQGQRVAIFFHPATRTDQIMENYGGTFGLNNDKTVSDGATIEIYVRADLSLFSVAINLVHELIHALGVPAFSNRLDAEGSEWDREITKDLFRGYDWVTAANNSSTGLAALVGAPDGGGSVAGTTGGSLIVGSSQADTLSAVGGGNLIHPQGGDNEVAIVTGTDLDTIVSSGGTLTVTLASDVNPGDVGTFSSADGTVRAITIGNRPAIAVEEEAGSSTTLLLKVGGQVYPASYFSSSVAALDSSYDIHVDYLGEFNGGSLGSAAAAVGTATGLVYRLAAVRGR